MHPQVRIETSLGSFTIEVLIRRAPLTAANFLGYVSGGYLEGSCIYRIVTPDNQRPPAPVGAALIQWGMNLPPEVRRPFAPVPHEPTSMTGLSHRDGAVSLARLAPGTGASEFFVCIGDQPELDFGGRRNPDGAGFAVFGQVVSGSGVLRAIYACAEGHHMLQRKIPILGVQRLDGCA